jgi:hypothetical protein
MTVQTYQVRIVNNRTGEERTVTVDATGPEDARSLALLDCFRVLGWRSCSASEAGKLVAE